ncbi:hypothetical protein ONE63_001430 [Megalurothrips usitatus]|uniref:Uncharacterized protein n=1 Tax=Megalurothrips usitatus TaxID=439358 RepID=A0AAV7XG60_9NEOP|nr:hypothetical protein ONE63_001430 [Megalurothrips usitatus]KAJ1523586.1 hypothetical protein ONE63_001430 [Megalurothrips usitatus]
MSMRYCLRWNNHQSNMLSVFDQLLHDESFVDVTLAVDGQLLRAHKMVLSACSPLFQALFIGHPDKHPIVILKDVPYNDMRCLLDFMYRGEVSVDHDRLTALLKVAESLRIKGLTEVNEEKCDIPSITNNLLSAIPSSHSTPVPTPPPHLQRIEVPHAGQKRTMPPLVASNPLLGSALTAPKRKRCRPRKHSGSSDDPHVRDASPHELEGDMDMEYDNRGSRGSEHGSPPSQEMMEIQMDYGLRQNSLSRLNKSSDRDDSSGLEDSSSQSPHKDSSAQKPAAPQTPRRRPKDDSEPGTSSQESGQAQFRIGSNGNSGSSSAGTGSGSSGSNSNAASPQNNGNGIGLTNSENLPPGFRDYYPFPGRLFAPAYLATPTLLEDVGNSEHGGEHEDMEDHEEDPINFSPNNCFPEPLQLKVENLEPKNLVKREMVDKRKPARPRKLPEQFTIGSIGSHCADFQLSLGHHFDGDITPPDFETYKSLIEQHNVGYETSDQEQKAVDGKGLDGSRSVRQYCVKEENIYRCLLCKKAYTHISNFCRHFITTHKGIKNEVPCPICGKLFTRKDNMVTHTKQVHRLPKLEKSDKLDKPVVPQP